MSKTYTLKLVHPRLGVCNMAIFHDNKRKETIIKEWRHKYGDKFFECNVAGNVTLTKKQRKTVTVNGCERFGKLIVHIPSDVMYDGPVKASKGTGEPTSTIHTHIYKQLSEGFKYRFKFVTYKKEKNEQSNTTSKDN